jgi:hypothetical protein
MPPPEAARLRLLGEGKRVLGRWAEGGPTGHDVADNRERMEIEDRVGSLLHAHRTEKGATRFPKVRKAY